MCPARQGRPGGTIEKQSHVSRVPTGPALGGTGERAGELKPKVGEAKTHCLLAHVIPRGKA
jgi:hypothetical protein